MPRMPQETQQPPKSDVGAGEANAAPEGGGRKGPPNHNRRQGEVSAQQPFRPQVFLFRTLVGIFIAQFIIFGYALVKCKSVSQCPQIGQRIENLCAVAIATTLSLLGGGAPLK